MPARPPLPDDCLTAEEAAAKLNMSVRHVRRMITERQIAVYRFGRSVRIDPADLAEYMQASRIEPITIETVWRDLRRAA